MVERYVFLKLEEKHASPAGRAAICAEVERVYPDLPGVRAVRVGVPADPQAAAAWDIALIVGFDSREAIPTYLESPGHRTFVDTFLAGKVAALKAWNFEVAVSR